MTAPVFGLTPADLDRIGQFIAGWMTDVYAADNPDVTEIATNAIILFIGAAQEAGARCAVTVELAP